MEGSTPVEEVNTVLRLQLDPSGVYSTLAGLVLAELGRIPSVGDSITSNGYQFTVRKMEKLRIERVLVQKGPV
jgi:CBS domain containing-hemolysin-like protein